MDLLTYLTGDEWIFIGILLVMVFGIGSAPRLVRKVYGLPEK